MLISLISRNNLLKRFNPAEEPLYRTALLVEFWIKPYGPPSFRVFPRSPVDRNIAPNSPVTVILTNLPGIIGRICGDDRGTNWHLGNLKSFEGWLVEPGIMGICRCNRTGKREAVPIDQSTEFVPLYLFIAIIAGRSPFFAEISLVSVAQ